MIADEDMTRALLLLPIIREVSRTPKPPSFELERVGGGEMRMGTFTRSFLVVSTQNFNFFLKK